MLSRRMLQRKTDRDKIQAMADLTRCSQMTAHLTASCFDSEGERRRRSYSQNGPLSMCLCEGENG